MQFFKLETHKIIKFALSLIAFFVIFSLQTKHGELKFDLKDSGLSSQKIYSSFAQSISNTYRHYVDILRTKKNAQEVSNQNEILKARLANYQELLKEKKNLENLLELKSKGAEFNMVIANATSKDIFTDNYSLFIDKGIEHGLQNLTGVITADGVVGYVTKLMASQSQVLLATDRLTSIDAVVQRTRARGIITGQSQSLLKLKYIERADDIKIGDIIITSNEQQYFPRGYPIGTVTKVFSSSSGVGFQAYIKPNVSFKKIENVILTVRK